MYDLPTIPPSLFHVPHPAEDAVGWRVIEVFAYDWPKQRVRVRTQKHMHNSPGYFIPMKHLEVRDI